MGRHEEDVEYREKACPRCGGEGSIEKQFLDTAEKETNYRTETITCPQCFGSGSILVRTRGGFRARIGW